MRYLNLLTFALCICAVVLGVTVISWAYIRTGYFVSPVKIALYLVVPCLIGTVGMLLLFAPIAWRALAILGAVGLGAGLAGHEVYWQLELIAAEARGHQTGTADEADQNLTEGERMWPPICGQAVMTESADGSIISRVVVDGEQIQTLAGPANILIARNVVSSKREITIARADQHGFNNPSGQWIANHVEVVALGDSFAYGADVDFGRGMVDQIRDRLGRTVNLGCGGNGPLLELAALKESAAPLKPRIVLWFYYEANDLTKDIVRERRSATLMRYLEHDFSQNLMARQNEIDRTLIALLETRAARARPAQEKTQNLPSFLWRDVLRLTGLRSVLGMQNEFSSSSLRLFERVLATARETVAGWNGRFVLVYLPSELRFASPFARWDTDGYRHAVFEAAQRQGFEVIDLVRAFSDVPRPRDLFAGHYTEEGYRLAATVIVDALERHQ